MGRNTAAWQPPPVASRAYSLSSVSSIKLSIAWTDGIVKSVETHAAGPTGGCSGLGCGHRFNLSLSVNRVSGKLWIDCKGQMARERAEW